ncbi:hypothetical protein Tco_0287468 [Tanacetum coccineum]
MNQLRMVIAEMEIEMKSCGVHFSVFGMKLNEGESTMQLSVINSHQKLLEDSKVTWIHPPGVYGLAVKNLMIHKLNNKFRRVLLGIQSYYTAGANLLLAVQVDAASKD